MPAPPPSEPRLSVVIVTWNVRDRLTECLESLEREGAPAWSEVLVVDNASTDGSADLVAERFPWARLIRSPENLGFSRGNNLAIRRCRGTYVLLLNPDTVIHPGALEALVAYLDHTPGCAAVGPRQISASGRTQYDAAVAPPTVWNTFCDLTLLSRAFPRSRVFCGRKMGWWAHDDDRDVPAIAGSAMLVRRDGFDRVGLLDEELFMCEDIDLCLRLRRACGTIHYLGSTTIVHYGSESIRRSGDVPRHWQIAYQSFWLYLRKHGHPWSAAVLSLMVMAWAGACWTAATLARPLALGRPGLAAALAHWRAIAVALWRWSRCDKLHFHHHLARAPGTGPSA